MMTDDYAGVGDEKPPLERDVQEFLANSLSASLGEPLTLIRTEYPVPVGRIDIVAKDRLDRLVAIELKFGVAGRDAIGQLQSYMGALMQENPGLFVRGILVASALDAKAEAALLVARDIDFVSFAIAFTFSQRLSGKSTYEDWLAGKQTESSEAKPAIWLPPTFPSRGT